MPSIKVNAINHIVNRRLKMPSIKVNAINHIGLVVRNEKTSKQFYQNLLGFTPHHKVDSWLVMNEQTMLHLIEIDDAEIVDSLFHQINHFAMEVDSLSDVLSILIQDNHKPFQMDFEGNEKQIISADDPLGFGLGTLFVADPDENLIEFVQIGKGLFTKEMQPKS